MAGATWSTFQPALKETWSQDDFEVQFYDNHPLLEDIERTDKHTIGEYVNVPLLLTRNGGFTVTGTAGSSALNAAGNVGPSQAQYTLAYNYQQVKVDHPAIVNSQGNANAVAGVLDTELEGASSMMRTQITRQVYQDQTALICQCASGGASTTVNLNATAGYDALVKGWLDVSMTVDIGTTSSEASLVADTVISAVSIDSTTPTITVGTSITETSSHYVSVANARSGSTSLEMNGLGNIISGSATLGGIAATNRWKGYVDSTTTDLTLDSLLAVQQQVQQFTNKVKPSMKVIMGFQQARRFYTLFQNQVRFQSDSQLAAGNTAGINWNGMTIVQDGDCPAGKVFFVDTDSLLLVTSPLGVHWANEITGGEKVVWGQGHHRVCRSPGVSRQPRGQAAQQHGRDDRAHLSRSRATKRLGGRIALPAACPSAGCRSGTRPARCSTDAARRGRWARCGPSPSPSRARARLQIWQHPLSRLYSSARSIFSLGSPRRRARRSAL
jgi:hypothetical protein